MLFYQLVVGSLSCTLPNAGCTDVPSFGSRIIVKEMGLEALRWGRGRSTALPLRTYVNVGSVRLPLS